MNKTLPDVRRQVKINRTFPYVFISWLVLNVVRNPRSAAVFEGFCSIERRRADRGAGLYFPMLYVLQLNNLYTQ